MYRVVILTFVIVAALARDVDEKQCRNAIQPGSVRCCAKGVEKKERFLMSDDLSECFKLGKDPVKCDREICIGKKKGFASDDGKIDKTKLFEVLTKEFGSEADLLKDWKAKCVDGNIDKYAPSEFCDLIKLKHCISMQLLINCPEWKDNAECQETKEIVEGCGKIMT